MIGRTLGGLFARLRRWWHVEDPEERIEGTGEVHLDPAYNSRYTAERRLRALSRAHEEALWEGQREAQREGQREAQWEARGGGQPGLPAGGHRRGYGGTGSRRP